MKVLTQILIVLAVLVVLLGIAAGVLYFLATTDDNAGKYEAEPSTDIVEPAVKAALTGQETEITQDQINGFFSYYIQENGLTLAGHRVKKLYLQLGETPGAVSLYLVCEGLGKDLGITAQGQMIYLEAGKEFSLQISDMKVGRLKVPASWALSWISSRLPEGMEAQEDTVVIGSQLLRIPLGDLQASLSLDGFRTEQGRAYVRVSGAVEALQEYLQKKIGESGLGDLLSGFGISLP